MDGILVWIADQGSVALEEPSDDLLGRGRQCSKKRNAHGSRSRRHPHNPVERRGERRLPAFLVNAVRMLAERPELQKHLRQNPEQIANVRRGGAPHRIPVPLHDALGAVRHEPRRYVGSDRADGPSAVWICQQGPK